MRKGISFGGEGKSPSVSKLVEGTPEQIERMKLTGSVFREVEVDKPCIPGEVINVDGVKYRVLTHMMLRNETTGEKVKVQNGG